MTPQEEIESILKRILNRAKAIQALADQNKIDRKRLAKLEARNEH